MGWGEVGVSACIRVGRLVEGGAAAGGGSHNANAAGGTVMPAVRWDLVPNWTALVLWGPCGAPLHVEKRLQPVVPGSSRGPDCNAARWLPSHRATRPILDLYAPSALDSRLSPPQAPNPQPSPPGRRGLHPARGW